MIQTLLMILIKFPTTTTYYLNINMKVRDHTFNLKGVAMVFSESKYFVSLRDQYFLRHKLLSEYFFPSMSETEFFSPSNLQTENIPPPPQKKP